MYIYTQDDFVIHIGPEPPSTSVMSSATPLSPVPPSTILSPVLSSTTLLH